MTTRGNVTSNTANRTKGASQRKRNKRYGISWRKRYVIHVSKLRVTTFEGCSFIFDAQWTPHEGTELWCWHHDAPETVKYLDRYGYWVQCSHCTWESVYKHLGTARTHERKHRHAPYTRIWLGTHDTREGDYITNAQPTLPLMIEVELPC